MAPKSKSVKNLLDLLSPRRCYFRSVLCIKIAVGISSNLDLTISLFDRLAILPNLRRLDIAIKPPSTNPIFNEMGEMTGYEVASFDVLKGVDNPFPLLEFFCIGHCLSLGEMRFGDLFYSQFLEKSTYLRHFGYYSSFVSFFFIAI